VNLLSIIYKFRICPPFGLFNRSFSSVKKLVFLNKDFGFGSCPVCYSSFRRSPASEAQSVFGHCAGPHEICIEKDARAAFTLPRYLSPCQQSSSFESRKSHRSLVTEASHFTGTLALSKGLETWRVAKSVICPEKFIGLCHNLLNLFHGIFLCFKLFVFSFLPDLTGSFIRCIRVGCCLKRCFRDDHFPYDSGEFSGHGGSCFSLDSGSLYKPLVSLAKIDIEFSHLESSFTQSPSEGSRSCFGDLPGVLLPVGDVASFRQTCPARNSVCIFEAMKISKFSHDDKPKYFTDAFGAGNNFEPVFETLAGFYNQSDISQDSVSLPFNGLNSFAVLPEHLSFKSVEFIPMAIEPSDHGSCINYFWSSGVGLVQLPSHDSFDLCGFFCDSVPLSGEYSQVSDFDRRDIGLWYEFTFHYLGDFCGRDFVGVSHSRSQLTKIKGIEQVNLIGYGLEHVPEPVVGSHRLDSDTDRFFEGLDESEYFSGAMVWNSNFFNVVGFVINSCIGSSSGVQIDS
jgi:hypothetical protein